ncbi:MAG: phage scaffolding protein [Vulcanibacillus sp.]
MDWLKELLKKTGFEDAKLDETVGEINKELPKHFVPKSQYNDLSEAKKQLESDLKDRDKQLTDLKKAVGDNEDLKKQIEQLQTDNKTKDEEHQAKIKDMAVATAIKLAVAGDVHDPDLLLSILDKSKIGIDENGNIKTGLEDQVKALRESKAFLFVQKEGDTRFKGASPAEGKDKGAGNGQKNPWSKEHYNLTEQGKILKENPELAKQLIAQAK